MLGLGIAFARESDGDILMWFLPADMREKDLYLKLFR
jgi:hypothetical protein